MIDFTYRQATRRARQAQARVVRSREDSRYAPLIIRPRNRFWELTDERGNLICLTVYKRGALEVARRLTSTATA